MGEGCFIVGILSTLWWTSSLWGDRGRRRGAGDSTRGQILASEECLLPHPQFPKYLPESGTAKAAVKR